MAGDRFLAHDDYYLPSLQLEVEEGGYSTPSSHFIGGTFSFVKADLPFLKDNPDSRSL
jgi:hypothetical protein